MKKTKVIGCSGSAIIRKGEYGVVIGYSAEVDGKAVVALSGPYNYGVLTLPHLIIVYLNDEHGKPMPAEKDIVVDWTKRNTRWWKNEQKRSAL